MGTFGLEGSFARDSFAGLVDRQGGQFRRSGDFVSDRTESTERCSLPLVALA